MIAALEQMTTPRLVRLYNKCYARMDYEPGGHGWPWYGWDWPTLRICHPGWYVVLRAIYDIIRKRRALLNLLHNHHAQHCQ